MSFAGVSPSAGQVIQVVTATDSTERSTTSTSFVTASNTLSVSITPSATSSRILILASFMGFATNIAIYTVYRNSTNLGTNSGIAFIGGENLTNHIGFHITDSPSTTSATTYQIYFRCQSGASYPAKINTPYDSNTLSTITALEIKG